MFVQMGFTASEYPGNSLQISCVKPWHQGQAPSILSLWVECSRSFKPQLPLQAGKCGRFGAFWQSMCPPPQPPAGPATTSHQARQHRGSPSTRVLLLWAQRRAEGVEEAAPWWFVPPAILYHHHHSPGQLCLPAPSISA